ncbi:cell division protein ZipA, partial [Neisseria gonorrhoeae]
VNDKMEEVSTQWLKDVRTYVLARQSEMLKVGIEPGGKTALRLFS